jgi:hypothetical protein
MNRIFGQLYGLDDYVILPEVSTDVKSRTNECIPKYPDNEKYHITAGKYPIFAAPMSCVVDDNNWKEFADNGVTPVIPRTVDYNKRVELMKLTFVAMGLKEFERVTEDPRNFFTRSYICVDIANGHMTHMMEMCKKSKTVYGDKIIIMAGNIARPETYDLYAKSGIDYIRLGIGSGNVCTTAANTGIHYPLGSLIFQCNERRNAIRHYHLTDPSYLTTPKLIADGGFKNFDQMIKALALGADYVMLGDLLARTWTACGKIYDTQDPIPNYDKPLDKTAALFSSKTVFREYYGMSTKKAQMEMGKTEEECRTAEGIVKYLPVRQFLDKWLDNFAHYLKSSMSYCNCTLLEDFIGFPCLGINTPMARNAFMK